MYQDLDVTTKDDLVVDYVYNGQQFVQKSNEASMPNRCRVFPFRELHFLNFQAIISSIKTVEVIAFMPVYNKLVRDKILDIIKADGLAYNSRVLKPEEHLTEIKKKLYEEAKEFDETTNRADALEEMADVLELLHAALKVYDADFAELEAIRVKKKEKRGGFDEGLYLIDVADN